MRHTGATAILKKLNCARLEPHAHRNAPNSSHRLLEKTEMRQIRATKHFEKTDMRQTRVTTTFKRQECTRSESQPLGKQQQLINDVSKNPCSQEDGAAVLKKKVHMWGSPLRVI